MLAAALATLLAVVVGGLAVGGNPVTRVHHAWDSFKGGYTAESAGSNRLLAVSAATATTSIAWRWTNS